MTTTLFFDMTFPKEQTKKRKISKLKIAFLIFGFIFFTGLGCFCLHWLLPRNFKATGEMLWLHLNGGAQGVPYYCSTNSPKGIAIVGTGDGGVSYWEENTAKSLSAAGYAVGIWDCRKFADSRKYNYKDLCDGFEAAVSAVRSRADLSKNTHVYYGGWSTGAEQALAAATSPTKPENLCGVWLAGPGERGRYGITTADLLGKTPQGANTFSLIEMANHLQNLPVVQFVAGLDPLDEPHLLDHFKGSKNVVPMKRMMHDMGSAGEVFQKKLLENLLWMEKQNQSR